MVKVMGYRNMITWLLSDVEVRFQEWFEVKNGDLRRGFWKSISVLSGIMEGDIKTFLREKVSKAAITNGREGMERGEIKYDYAGDHQSQSW